MSRKWGLCAFFLVLAVSFVPVRAASLNDDLRSKYEGKVMMLRNFYCGKALMFDDQGSLISGGHAGSWTMCRDIRVKEIKIYDNKIRIKGQRIYLVRGDTENPFRDVIDQEPETNKKQKAWEDLLRSQEVSIQAQLPTNADDAQVQLAMDRLFYASQQEFFQAPPELWKCFFHVRAEPAVCGKGQFDVQEVAELGPVVRVGGKVKAPKALYNPEPSFNDEARLAKYMGTTVMTVVVDPAGQVSMIHVMRPLGLGLDEQAAATISTWKFEPALRDGTPVAVQVNIEVTFNLY